MGKIYGFVNSGVGEWLECVAIAEDGTVLAGHCSSSEAWAAHDLGIFKEDKYNAHYPDGWSFEYVPRDKIATHEHLQAAFAKHRASKAVAAPVTTEAAS